MFKITVKNPTDDATIYAVIRMNQKEYLALRTYMHAAEGANITFPYGVTLNVRGRGWYQLNVGGKTRQIEKMAFAQKVIGRFLKDEEAKVDEALKFLAPIMIDESMRAVSFSSVDTRSNGFGYLGSVSAAKENKPEPAKVWQLQALAAKFARPSK